jgi:hypothetical protein
MSSDIEWVRALLAKIVPRKDPLVVRTKLEEDECHWFRMAIEHDIIRIQPCTPHCGRNQELGTQRIDEFIVPHQAENRRHLFELKHPACLCREYIPHIAAYAKAVLHNNYPLKSSSFSRYQMFNKDVLTKKKGQSFETDAEFHMQDCTVFLLIEAKSSRSEVDKVVKSITNPQNQAPLKEYENILALHPKWLWFVGPGTVDPAIHIFMVIINENQLQLKRHDVLPHWPQ